VQRLGQLFRDRKAPFARWDGRNFSAAAFAIANPRASQSFPTICRVWRDAHASRRQHSRASISGKPPPIRLDHPSIEVLADQEAHGHDAAVAISVARIASNDSSTDMVRRCEGGLLAATPGRAIGPSAFLPTFRRVDAVQANARAVDLDRIAVDDGGGA